MADTETPSQDDTIKGANSSAELFAVEDNSPEMELIRNALFRQIGKPLKRKEDKRLVTGQGRFSDDFSMPGQVYACMVRSPYAHANIVSIDSTDAKKAPGIVGVFTGQDVQDDGLNPIPHNPVPSTNFDMKLTAPNGDAPFIGPHYILPTDKVRHVGEAVAVVVAETQAQALDAAELVVVEYEELPHVVRSRDAVLSEAPNVWGEMSGNVFIDSKFGDWDATDAAFARAAHVTTAEYFLQRVTAVTIEPRAALAHFDPETDRYTLLAGSGGAVRQKGELSAMLGIDKQRLRVQSYDVGGNFGARNRVYVEFGIVLWASEKIRRPVKFTATRSEAFLTDYQGRDLVSKVELALDADGKFLAMRADNLSNVGSHCVSLSPLSKGSGLITGSYDIPVAALRARAVYTNTMATQAYRSSGRPEVTYAIECLVEKAAGELGIDPLELRRRNLIDKSAMPYRNAVGSLYDSGEYECNMDRVLELADWTGFEQRKQEAADRGKLLGRGFANYVESSIGSPKERAEIEVRPDGFIDVVIGTQPSGQGHETSFAQVVADMLQTDAEQVNIILGDTDIVSVGGGSHSGRSMRHAGTVMAMASADLLKVARERAASLFDVDAKDLEFNEGHFIVADTNHQISLHKLAEATADQGALRAARTNEMHTPVFPNGAAICEIEIDRTNGFPKITRYTTVDDVGRCINPLIVHGQTHGGIAQGVGQALWEECVVDIESGQPLAGTFMDYGMPRSDSLPNFKTDIAEVFSPTNPLGIKAGGEGGTTPALATVTLAVLDALKPFGVQNIDMPLTPFKIWQAMNSNKSSQIDTNGETI